MIYTKEVQMMCPVTKGAKHEPAPIPEEGKWVYAKRIEDISAFTHGVGWCAPQQGACKLTLNVKEGIIEEALIETIGCSGMTQSAAMAVEILQGKTILKPLIQTSYAMPSTPRCGSCSFRSFTDAARARFPMTASQWVPDSRTSARECVHRSGRCTARRRKVPAIWR